MNKLLMLVGSTAVSYLGWWLGAFVGTMTAFMVNAAGGDASQGSANYQAIFAVGLSLFVFTLFFNCVGFYLRHRYREVV